MSQQSLWLHLLSCQQASSESTRGCLHWSGFRGEGREHSYSSPGVDAGTEEVACFTVQDNAVRVVMFPESRLISLIMACLI